MVGKITGTPLELVDGPHAGLLVDLDEMGQSLIVIAEVSLRGQLGDTVGDFVEKPVASMHSGYMVCEVESPDGQRHQAYCHVETVKVPTDL